MAARVEFLPCALYKVADGDWSRTLLVEKRLDSTKFRKWNSNNGHVSGANVSVQDILNREEVTLTCIEEGDEDEEEDDEFMIKNNAMRKKFTVLVEHYPQAFSHYSYRYTKRERIVLDLQGVLDSSTSPAIYCLTDPAIQSMAKGTFGRTDMAREGVQSFFRTHVCNPLCGMLGLSEYH